MRLITERLILRELAHEDWAAVLAYQSDPRYLRYYPWTERTESDVRDFVCRLVAQQEQEPRRTYQFAITLPAEGGRLIGNCGLRVNAAERREGNIGYELSPDTWGHGYATEAAQVLLTFGFDELSLHRVWAECVADNAASARVLEKLGLRREGHFREYAHFKGRWWDHAVYAILEHEWRDRVARPGS